MKASDEGARTGGASNPPLLEVRDLSVEFRTREGVARAVDRVSYVLNEGQTLAVLGESGSGKSVSARAVMGILETPPAHITGGQVLFRGVDLLSLTPEERRKHRGRSISMVFQDALSSLNPVFSVGWQIAEMFRIHEGMSRGAARRRAIELMEQVKIPAARSRFGDYPHEFSGGMRQRIMIAIAIALDPDVLIADEPTTALDVTVQAQIMDLLQQIQKERNMGLILISHDLGVVASVADVAAVMYAGRIVEYTPIDDLYHAPAHPYSKGLLESIPRIDLKGHDLNAIAGLPPSLTHLPVGCAFNERCGYARSVCFSERPPLKLLEPGHASACHFATEVLSESR